MRWTIFTSFSLAVLALASGACPSSSGASCFRETAVWVSIYNHHNSQPAVDAAFEQLKANGITTINFNVWNNGVAYFETATGRGAGVEINDHLGFAVSAARRLGLKLVAWFEYGSMANYNSLSSFGNTAASRGWLLTNGGSYFGSETGQYIYLDVSNRDVRIFLGGLVSDAVRNYNIDGVQLDDHFGFPNGFDQVDALSQTDRYAKPGEAIHYVVDQVKAVKNVEVSFVPSPLDFARSHANIDWVNWLGKSGYPDIIAPQYYYTSYSSFRSTLMDDLGRISSGRSSFAGAAIRLSGSSAPLVTPCDEVVKMIELVEAQGLPYLGFWFADDFLNGNFPDLSPHFAIC